MICNELLVTADVRNALIHDYDPPLVAADPVNKIMCYNKQMATVSLALDRMGN